MSDVRELRCPTCRGSGGFQIVESTKVASTIEVVGLDSDGALVLGDVLAETAEKFYVTREIVCESCGHQWVTTRGVSGRG